MGYFYTALGAAIFTILSSILITNIFSEWNNQGPSRKIYVNIGTGQVSYDWEMTDEEFEKQVSYTDRNEIKIKSRTREFVSSSYYIIFNK